MIDLLFVLLGVAMLTLGGEALIRGALGTAQRFKVSPLLSGLVIVGFGTSAPELAVSIDAAVSGRPDIAVGNVVGSNIGNVLLILGLCAVITPLAVRPLALRRDALCGVGASVLFLILVGGSALGRADAVILLLALAGYLIWAYRSERAPLESPTGEVYRAEAAEVAHVPTALPRTLLFSVVGLVLLVGGAQVLLHGAVSLATNVGLSEAVIGLTLVAVGTSLPELTISVIAAFRRHADVAIGNVLGSNLFNLLGILGISALLQPLPVPARILQFDQWVLLGTALLLFFFLYTGRRLSRGEGIALLVGYGAYLTVSLVGMP